MTDLYWLEKHPDFRSAWRALKLKAMEPQAMVEELQSLSNYNLEFTQYILIDRKLQDSLQKNPIDIAGYTRVKLALLSSSTIEHLIPLIRVAALRRRILVDCYITPYNSYRQEILDATSALYAYKPDVVWLSIDAHTAEHSDVNELTSLWTTIKSRLSATIVQETIAIPALRIFGHLDNALSFTPFHQLTQFNHALIRGAANNNVLLMDHDGLAARVGKTEWMQSSLWHHAKQTVAPSSSALYGDHVARILAAIYGKSQKCLVLDLDNTLWGGVIGDDGIDGIEVGAGSGVGEAFSAFQEYVKRLSERGIIIAACSKNDEKNARLPFDQHPDMTLKKDHFSVFIANWNDKASNLRHIAELLNIGLDSLVFFDDNPTERALVRQLCPQVIVHETPEDPALFAESLSDAGYFETVLFSKDDAQRNAQYRGNAERAHLQSESADLQSFLTNLRMEMEVAPFDSINRGRIVQLINKSNQFNLTTRRYNDAQIESMEKNPSLLTFYARLQDAYGDNGIISIIISKPMTEGKTLLIDTWLMSCRVLGRQVEHALLNTLVTQARGQGYTDLLGEYIPSDKNQLVSDHYSKLGFILVGSNLNDQQLWRLKITEFEPKATAINIKLHTNREAK